MGRRSKAELLQANYYEWLEACNKLRARKKDGFKLTSEEKLLLKTMPTPEAPYRSGDVLAAKKAKKPKAAKKTAIDFDKTVEWPVRGQAFLCAVFNVPYGDEQCLLFCDRDDCPFHGIGYFRAHGVKF
jgi:hypothetical protein